jgi:uncharacterized protein YndB with AHSA1/START domain
MIEPHHELTLTRTFDAPRELVYAAFTDANHLTQWFGPRGFSIARCVSEAHPGGRLEIDMRKESDGQIYPMRGEYLEVDPPARFVTFTSGQLEGGARNTFTFVEVDGKTQLTMHVHVLQKTDLEIVRPFLEGMKGGWQQSYEKLDAYLASGPIANPGEARRS